MLMGFAQAANLDHHVLPGEGDAGEVGPVSVGQPGPLQPRVPLRRQLQQSNRIRIIE